MQITQNKCNKVNPGSVSYALRPGNEVGLFGRNGRDKKRR